MKRQRYLLIALMLLPAVPAVSLHWLRLTAGWQAVMPGGAGVNLKGGPAAAIAINSGLPHWPVQLGFSAGWARFNGPEDSTLDTLPLAAEFTWHPFPGSGTVSENRGFGFFAGTGTALQIASDGNRHETAAAWLLTAGIRWTIPAGYKTAMITELRWTLLRDYGSHVSTVSILWGWKFALNKGAWL